MGAHWNRRKDYLGNIGTSSEVEHDTSDEKRNNTNHKVTSTNEESHSLKRQAPLSTSSVTPHKCESLPRTLSHMIDTREKRIPEASQSSTSCSRLLSSEFGTGVASRNYNIFDKKNRSLFFSQGTAAPDNEKYDLWNKKLLKTTMAFCNVLESLGFSRPLSEALHLYSKCLSLALKSTLVVTFLVDKSTRSLVAYSPCSAHYNKSLDDSSPGLFSPDCCSFQTRFSKDRGFLSRLFAQSSSATWNFFPLTSRRKKSSVASRRRFTEGQATPSFFRYSDSSEALFIGETVSTQHEPQRSSHAQYEDHSLRQFFNAQLKMSSGLPNPHTMRLNAGWTSPCNEEPRNSAWRTSPRGKQPVMNSEAQIQMHEDARHSTLADGAFPPHFFFFNKHSTMKSSSSIEEKKASRFQNFPSTPFGRDLNFSVAEQTDQAFFNPEENLTNGNLIKYISRTLRKDFLESTVYQNNSCHNAKQFRRKSWSTLLSCESGSKDSFNDSSNGVYRQSSRILAHAPATSIKPYPDENSKSTPCNSTCFKGCDPRSFSVDSDFLSDTLSCEQESCVWLNKASGTTATKPYGNLTVFSREKTKYRRSSRKISLINHSPLHTSTPVQCFRFVKSPESLSIKRLTECSNKVPQQDFSRKRFSYLTQTSQSTPLLVKHCYKKTYASRPIQISDDKEWLDLFDLSFFHWSVRPTRAFGTSPSLLILSRVLYHWTRSEKKKSIGLICVVFPSLSAVENKNVHSLALFLDYIAAKTEPWIRHLIQLENLRTLRLQNHYLLCFHRTMHRSLTDTRERITCFLQLLKEAVNAADAALYVIDTISKKFICYAGNPNCIRHFLPSIDEYHMSTFNFWCGVYNVFMHTLYPEISCHLDLQLEYVLMLGCIGVTIDLDDRLLGSCLIARRPSRFISRSVQYMMMTGCCTHSCPAETPIRTQPLNSSGPLLHNGLFNAIDSQVSLNDINLNLDLDKETSSHIYTSKTFLHPLKTNSTVSRFCLKEDGKVPYPKPCHPGKKHLQDPFPFKSFSKLRCDNAWLNESLNPLYDIMNESLVTRSAVCIPIFNEFRIIIAIVQVANRLLNKIASSTYDCFTSLTSTSSSKSISVSSMSPCYPQFTSSVNVSYGKAAVYDNCTTNMCYSDETALFVEISKNISSKLDSKLGRFQFLPAKRKPYRFVGNEGRRRFSDPRFLSKLCIQDSSVAVANSRTASACHLSSATYDRVQGQNIPISKGKRHNKTSPSKYFETVRSDESVFYSNKSVQITTDRMEETPALKNISLNYTSEGADNCLNDRSPTQYLGPHGNYRDDSNSVLPFSRKDLELLLALITEASQGFNLFSFIDLQPLEAPLCSSGIYFNSIANPADSGCVSYTALKTQAARETFRALNSLSNPFTSSATSSLVRSQSFLRAPPSNNLQQAWAPPAAQLNNSQSQYSGVTTGEAKSSVPICKTSNVQGCSPVTLRRRQHQKKKSQTVAHFNLLDSCNKVVSWSSLKKTFLDDLNDRHAVIRRYRMSKWFERHGLLLRNRYALWEKTRLKDKKNDGSKENSALLYKLSRFNGTSTTLWMGNNNVPKTKTKVQQALRKPNMDPFKLLCMGIQFERYQSFLRRRQCRTKRIRYLDSPKPGGVLFQWTREPRFAKHNKSSMSHDKERPWSMIILKLQNQRKSHFLLYPHTVFSRSVANRKRKKGLSLEKKKKLIPSNQQGLVHPDLNSDSSFYTESISNSRVSRDEVETYAPQSMQKMEKASSTTALNQFSFKLIKLYKRFYKIKHNIPLYSIVTHWGIGWWNYTCAEMAEFFIYSLQVSHFDTLLTPQAFQCLEFFFYMIAGSYKADNPYHNFFHAIQVYHIAWLLLFYHKFAQYLKPVEILGTLLGALCHDVDHPGLNNNFLVTNQHPSALVYNDISVLENHHCSFTFRLLECFPELDFRKEMSQQDRQSFRHTFISGILATDMQYHSSKIKTISSRFEQKESEPIQRTNAEDRKLITEIIVHAADISNPVTPFAYAQRWASLIMDEFNRQCYQETILGLSPTPFTHCRTLKSRIDCQIEFLEYLVIPMWKTLTLLSPTLMPVVHKGESNVRRWQRASQNLEKNKDNLKHSSLFTFSYASFHHRHPLPLIQLYHGSIERLRFSSYKI